MEVLSLQFGHFSNHVGAHFWNIQDEIATLEETTQEQHEDEVQGLDFDRLFHCSERGRGDVRWRPRLLLVDKKGAFGMPGDAVLDAEAASVGNHAHACLDQMGFWDFGAVSHCADPVRQHPFQQDMERDERVGASSSSWDATTLTCSGAAVINGYGWEGMDVDAEEDEDLDADESHGYHVSSGNDKGATKLSCVRPSADYDFPNTVQTWSDFLKIKLPSGSTHELRGCHHGITPFASFFDGLEIRGRDEAEEILDAVRRQVENCDQLDAIHCVIDTHDGFAGVGELALQWLREEQPKCGKLVAAVFPELDAPAVEGKSSQDSSCSTEEDRPAVAALDVEACTWISAAFSLAGILDRNVDVWLPLAVPLWSTRGPEWLPSLRRNSFYESSAPIAVALETATLPYRLRGGLRPASFLGGLAPSGRPVCGLLQAMPFHVPQPATLGSALFDLSGLAPHATNPHTSLVLRGASPRRLVELTEHMHPRARRMSFAHESPVPLPLPFPQVFSPKVSVQGLILANGSAERLLKDDVEECPVATKLHAAAEAAGRAAALQRMSGMLKAKQYSSWASGVRDRYGVEADEFREVLETITQQLECGAGDASDESC